MQSSATIPFEVQLHVLNDFQNKGDARAWLNGADSIFPFWLVCKILDVHEGRLRDQIRRQIADPTPELLSALFAVPVGRVNTNPRAHTSTG